ncbi:MAG: hypothetical protein CM1200mP41_32020 [Gammaproteobacteria bacterium]|nr:MAG: hypothetical protein CM1200mP41_32020 [Gammaproteobacteria bacterium]
MLSDELETYVQRHCQPEDKLLQELRVETHKTLKYPQMQVGPVEGALLRLLVSISGASNVSKSGLSVAIPRCAWRPPCLITGAL